MEGATSQVRQVQEVKIEWKRGEVNGVRAERRREQVEGQRVTNTNSWFTCSGKYLLTYLRVEQCNLEHVIHHFTGTRKYVPNV